MKQQDFEAQHAPQWRLLENRLDGNTDALPAAQFPQQYRGLCHQLAVAKHRRYSPFLIERLNALVMRCHEHLYAADRKRGIGWRFFSTDFPHALYINRHLIGLAALLFVGSALAMGFWCYFDTSIVYSVMSAGEAREYQSMYDPSQRALGRPRQSDTDLMMFGFYIKNNIGISFRMFASGLLGGIGSLFFIVYNGVAMGAVAGFLTHQGFAETFYPFVIGHGAFELTALIVSGGAGLRLGGALLAPGSYSRVRALRIAGRETATLMIGVALMLTIAAFLEAFWSSGTALPMATKLGVGAMLWLLVCTYLFSAGRLSRALRTAGGTIDAA